MLPLNSGAHYSNRGSFPNGIPNPLLPENRGSTIDAVLLHGADMGKVDKTTALI
jgi:hypothetical protein